MKKLLLILLILFLAGCLKAEAATTAITDVDNRYQLSNPVAVEVISLAVDTTPSGGLSHSVGTTTITKSGRIRQVCTVIPDLSYSSALSVTVVNADSQVLWTSSDYTSGSSNIQIITADSTPYVAGTTTIQITTNMSQSDVVDATTALIFYME